MEFLESFLCSILGDCEFEKYCRYGNWCSLRFNGSKKNRCLLSYTSPPFVVYVRLSVIFFTEKLQFLYIIDALTSYSTLHFWSQVPVNEADEYFSLSLLKIVILLLLLLQGSRCILAGDHLQLPPTVQSVEAEKKGLGNTLFERLADLYGEAVMSMLTVQYRMHELIMSWSSKELYNNKVVNECLP